MQLAAISHVQCHTGGPDVRVCALLQPVDAAAATAACGVRDLADAAKDAAAGDFDLHGEHHRRDPRLEEVLEAARVVKRHGLSEAQRFPRIGFRRQARTHASCVRVIDLPVVVVIGFASDPDRKVPELERQVLPVQPHGCGTT